MRSSIRFSFPAMLLLICLLLSACRNPEETRNDAVPEPEETPALTFPVTLKAGYSTGADDPRGRSLELMKRLIEEETQGQVLLEIYPGGKLGSDAELIAGLITGEVDLTVSSAGNFALYAPRVGASAMPFLFRDFETAWEFIDSDVMQDLCRELEPYNMHVLAFFDNGFRCVTTTDRPVRCVADMAGLNIRTPDNQIVMETMSELGANPRSYPFASLPRALKDGVFDAQENPIPVIYNSELYLVQKYLSVTNHSYDAMPLVIRQDIWDQLPESCQNAILDAAGQAQEQNRETVARQTEEYVELLEEKGMVIYRPDLKEFALATAGVREVFETVYGEELLQVLEKIG